MAPTRRTALVTEPGVFPQAAAARPAQDTAAAICDTAVHAAFAPQLPQDRALTSAEATIDRYVQATCDHTLSYVAFVTNTGPLAGVKVIELGGIGPGPHAAMMLADLGADVVRVRRPGGLQMPAENVDLMHRGKRVVDLDVKKEPQTLLDLAAKADVLLDCFRPGTCERLGIGPDDCAAVNPRLIFARITGWGQDGPLAMTAGHDINYLSQTGALSRHRLPRQAAGRAAEPGRRLRRRVDVRAARHRFGALRAGASGQGQVIDAAMVDGVSILSQMMWTMKATGSLKDEREAFLLDGGAPFYRTYESSDGRYMAVGAIEPQFFAQLLTGLGLSPEERAQPVRHERLSRDAQALHRPVREQDPRRVDRGLRGHRRMCDTGAHLD